MNLSRLIAVVFGFSLTYAVLRYNVFKGVPFDHLPLYVTNKAVSMTALLLIGVSHLARNVETRRRCGMAGFAAAGFHVLLSLALLSPAYYEKLFLSPDGSKGLALVGELSLLAGASAFFLLVLIAWPKRPETAAAWQTAIPRLVRGVLALTAFHCLFYGWSGWWTPDRWPGFLPPITLLSFLFAAGTLLVGALRKPPVPKELPCSVHSEA